MTAILIPARNHHRCALFGLIAGLCASLIPATSQARPGDVDPSFGANGVLSFPLAGRGAIGGGGESGASDVAPLGYLPDGDLIIAAQTSYPKNRLYTETHFAVARLEPSGQLDPGFGSGGVTELELDRVIPGPEAVALDNEGRTVALLSGYPYRQIVRLLPSGQLDPTFFGDGIGEVEQNASLEAVDVQDDGRIVIGGFTRGEGLNADLIVARLLENGQLDPSFGSNGVVTKDVDLADRATAVRLDSQGRIVIAGYAAADNSPVTVSDLLFGRLLANGDPDPSFSGDGFATVDPVPDEPNPNEVLDFQIDGQDRPVALTSTLLTGALQRNLLRLSVGGEVDPAFGASGLMPVDNHASRLAIQPDGRLLVASSFYRTVSLSRMLADGSADASFGQDGSTALYPAPQTFSGDLQADMLVSGDQVLLGGVALDGFDLSSDGRLLRIRLDSGLTDDADADGVLDPTDPCRGVYEPQGGCPNLARELTLERHLGKRWKGFVGGWLSGTTSVCLNTTVFVYRKRRGPDKLMQGVASTGLDLDLRPARTQWLYQRSGPLARAGRYYARVRPSFDPTLGHCSKARSQTVELPPVQQPEPG